MVARCHGEKGANHHEHANTYRRPTLIYWRDLAGKTISIWLVIRDALVGFGHRHCLLDWIAWRRPRRLG